MKMIIHSLKSQTGHQNLGEIASVLYKNLKSQISESFGTNEKLFINCCFTKGEEKLTSSADLFIQCRNIKFRGINLLPSEMHFQKNRINFTWTLLYIFFQQGIMNLQIALFFIFQKIVKGVKMTGDVQPSASIFSSSDGISRLSESDSRLGFVDPASTSPSDDKFSAVVPEDVPNKCWTGALADDAAERLYVKIPIGWSNLQLGPNLQIP